MNIPNNIWIGLVQVSGKPGNMVLGYSKGAYVNVLSLASSPMDFETKVVEAVNNLGLDFVQIEDSELFSDRSKNYEIDESIKNIAIDVRASKELRFGIFHTFH